jgi:hypothetical protein
MKHGLPVPLCQFHVDMTQATAPPDERDGEGETARAWQGDVERIPFPFRFGVVGNLLPRGFDFDLSGEWLLTASAKGMLHAWRSDGSQVEVLPRAMVKGEVFTQVEAVLGVAGGFVVAGILKEQLTAAHYDFTRRLIKAYVLGPAASAPWKHSAPWKWYYFPELHSVAVRERTTAFAVDLDTGGVYPLAGSPVSLIARARQACAEAHRYLVPPPQMNVWMTFEERPSRGPFVLLDRTTGTVVLDGDGSPAPPWETFMPMADGVPILKNHRILQARCRGNMLAATFCPDSEPNRIALRLFRGPDGIPLSEHSHGARWSFTLSHDGGRLARQIGDGMVEVRDLSGGTVWTTSKGKCHQHMHVELGEMWLTARVGKWTHLLRWDAGLLVRSSRGNYAEFVRRQVTGAGLRTASQEASPDLVKVRDLCYDNQRFASGVAGELFLLVDTFGQLAVCDRTSGDLLVMFFIFREQVAAWMPDGTRYGPASITGGPATPGAPAKIAGVLRQAVQRSKESHG